MFLVSVVSVAYPPVYSVLRIGARGYFSYVRGDAFLYLTIARNSRGAFFTLDGSTPTNGFHPLWQYYLAALTPRGIAAGSMAPLQLAFWSSLVCVALGAGLAALAIQRCTRSTLLGLLVVPGVYYMLAGSIFASQPIWELVSGMESGVSTLFGGALLFLFAQQYDLAPQALFAARGLRSPFLRIGLLLPFVVLSRLDDVFLLPTLAAAVALCFPEQSWRARMLAVIMLTLPTAAALGIYVSWNHAYAGTFLPISGMAKGSFALGANLYIMAAALFAPLVDLKNAISVKQTDAVVLYNAGHRVAQLLGPSVFCGVYGLLLLRRPQSWRRAFSLALCGYTVLKVGYNVACVNLWHQGGWYFALSMLTVSFLAALLLEGWPARLLRGPVLPWATPVVYAGYLLLAATHYAGWGAFISDRTEYDYMQARDSTAAALRKLDRQPKLIAFDDGITAYALPFPTLHGFAFAGDLATFRALRSGQLLHHAYARGYRILTSAYYFPATEPLTTPDAARRFLGHSMLEADVKREFDQFDLRLVYVEPTTHAPFFAFAPRAATQPAAPVPLPLNGAQAAASKAQLKKLEASFLDTQTAVRRP